LIDRKPPLLRGLFYGAMWHKCPVLLGVKVLHFWFIFGRRCAEDLRYIDKGIIEDYEFEKRFYLYLLKVRNRLGKYKVRLINLNYKSSLICYNCVRKAKKWNIFLCIFKCYASCLGFDLTLLLTLYIWYSNYNKII